MSANPKIINQVLLIICDTAWTKSHLITGWRLTGATVTVEHFGTTMGRRWDSAGLYEHRERNARWRKLASEIAANDKLDVVFMVAFDDVLEEETLQHFKSLGARLVLFNTDMLTQWYRVLRSLRYMDLVCYGYSDHLDHFQRMGVPLLNFGFAALPPTPLELSAPPISYDGILYLGSPWLYRQMILQQLADANLPLRIYGHNWDRREPWPRTPGKWRKALHDTRWYLVPRLREEGGHLLGEFIQRYFLPNKEPAVRDEYLRPGIVQGPFKKDEFVALARGAAINLGFTHMMSDVAQEYPRMIRLREFEVPMCGGFYLTQNCPELSKYYEVGREIAVWETAKDVVEQCRYYLAHPEERARIAEAGRQRALGHHTWVHRFSRMASELGMQLPCESAQLLTQMRA